MPGSGVGGTRVHTPCEHLVVSTSKVLVDFAKDNENLKILGGAMGEKELTVDEIKTLA